MFTEPQTRLLDRCHAAGFGLALFAASVAKSGRCSEKQQEAMQRMLSAFEYRQNNRPTRTSRQTMLDAAFADYSEGGHF
jgi:hypothetical protein